MKRPKACLFDLDGVLLDTEPLHGMIWNETALELGVKLHEEALISLKGKKRSDCIRQLSEWIPGKIDEKDLLKIHKKYSQEYLKDPPSMNGAKELIEWCYSNHIKMVLVTSSSSVSMKLKTKNYMWFKFIKNTVCGDDKSLTNGKPSPDPYLLAAKRINVDPSDCWAIEDSIAGSESAQRAGCIVWALNLRNTQVANQHKYINITGLNEFLDGLKKSS